ncbi:MAG: type II secretion system F family protein [Bacteroidota bacterium]
MSLPAFTRVFSVMIGARLTVVEALDAARAATPGRRMQHILGQVEADVRRGRALSDALAAHPKTFDALYVGLVRVGEAAGVLDDALRRLADGLDRQQTLRRKVRSALAYPALVILVAVLAVGFFLVEIVPTFAGMFSQFGAELPGPTKLVIRAGHTLSTQAVPLMIGLLLTSAGTVYAGRTPSGRLLWDRVRFRLPFAGALLKKQVLAGWCQTLGTLLAGGVPLAHALELTGRTTPSPLLARDVRRLDQAIRRGASFGRQLARSRLFPPAVAHMLGAGERTARLADMATYVGDHFEQEVEDALDGLTSMIEPLLIAGIGLIVGGLLTALYLPMFDLMNVIG